VLGTLGGKTSDATEAVTDVVGVETA